jgi:hypothetical protein
MIDLKVAAAGFVPAPQFADGIVASIPATVTSDKAAGQVQTPRSIAPAPRYGEVLPQAIVPLKISRANLMATGGG